MSLSLVLVCKKQSMQTVLSLFVDSMQKAKHMYANCVNLSGRQFAKSLYAKSYVCKWRYA